MNKKVINLSYKEMKKGQERLHQIFTPHDETLSVEIIES